VEKVEREGHGLSRELDDIQLAHSVGCAVHKPSPGEGESEGEEQDLL
jgi:hypothetical protein